MEAELFMGTTAHLKDFARARLLSERWKVPKANIYVMWKFPLSIGLVENVTLSTALVHTGDYEPFVERAIASRDNVHLILERIFKNQTLKGIAAAFYSDNRGLGIILSMQHEIGERAGEVHVLISSLGRHWHVVTFGYNVKEGMRSSDYGIILIDPRDPEFILQYPPIIVY